VPTTGVQDIDALLSWWKWDTSNLTYGFPATAAEYATPYYGRAAPNRGEPDDAFFERATPELEKAMPYAFRQIEEVTELTISPAMNKHPDIAVAITGFAPDGRRELGHAMYPGRWGDNGFPIGQDTDSSAGDIWFQTEMGGGFSPALRPQLGDLGWGTMLHELGHALGLKHPGDTTVSPFMPRPERDSPEFTVMTSGVAAHQTLMMDDIRALQWMYGANFETRKGDTTYKFDFGGEMTIDSQAQGHPVGNKLFLTIWDGNGTDTYDFSGYPTNLAVDLTPGRWSVTRGRGGRGQSLQCAAVWR
jgi:serralysin